jgi:peptide deformylase
LSTCRWTSTKAGQGKQVLKCIDAPETFDILGCEVYTSLNIEEDFYLNMALRKIIYADDTRLKQKAKRVKQFGPPLKALADDMLETMHAAHGLGLAASQIGLLQRLFVVQLPEDEEDPQSGKPFVLVNPEVVKTSRHEVEGEEGCLSIPTWYGLVWRPEWVEVKAQDTNGKPMRIKAEGLLARVFLHEMDHLDGVLFVDRVESPDKLWQVKPEDLHGERGAELEKSPVAEMA